ncbi:WD40 repeat-like protein [Trichoderma ceciliae]
MDPQQSRHITNNRTGDNTNIHQGDVIHNHLPEDDMAKCLSDLRITDPRDDKIRIESTKGGLLQDSYKWIFEHGDFQQWRDNEDSRLLWIKGDPGKGKTMLLCGIVNELSPRQNDKTLISYFFCQAADSRINSATAVLRGLIYMAVQQQLRLISHVQKKYKHGGETLFRDVNAWTALSEILSGIFEDASLEQAFIIIDALDECVADLPNLLDFISTKSALFSRVKWIVSSRNWPSIEDHLNSATQQTRLCLELNENSISTAVNIYIKHQVKQLAQMRGYDDETKDTVQRQLSIKSNNTFLWVALVCQNLRKISLQNTIARLSEFPPGLDSLYKRMMEQIRHMEDVRDVDICYRILATVLLVYQPVTLAELGYLIESPNRDPTDVNLLHRAVELCGSFLTTKGELVYIIHQSAKDYLNKTISTILPAGSANMHGVIFSQSLKAMSATLQRNMYDLDPLGLTVNKIKAPDPDPLRVIHYLCIHWVNHFCDMHCIHGQPQREVDHEKSQMIILFLQKYLLYWLEALGLIGHIEDAVLSIIRLENLLRGKSLHDQFQEPALDSRLFRSLRELTNPFKSPDSQSLSRQSPDRQLPKRQLLELTQDSRRFIQHNSLVIANSPLQVYASALVFCPSNSWIRKKFKTEEPQWLKLKPTVDYNWSSCLQTLEGHSGWVKSVTFSADGRYLVSGSDDHTVKIWDAKTGKERQTLKGHSYSISSVAFSADGRHIASGSGDNTIKIWDAITGKERHTLKGHSDIFDLIAFSADSCYLASQSWGHTIKIWNITTGKEQQILKGHKRKVISFTFSADGCSLISGSNDNTIKIWDIKTGKERRTIKVSNNPFHSVTFSTDGRYLALGFKNHIIKIWNITTGKEYQTLKSYQRWLSSITFSLDNNYLAAVSHDNIKIWDITTGKKQQTLKGHSSLITSVSFSADGYLASGSSDWTIKIWDIIIGKEQQRLQGHKENIKSINFSADGHYIASGSEDTTIKIWDATTGKEQQTLKGHSDSVQSVVFSADGHLASGSEDYTIKIWDITTGKKRQTFKGHTRLICSVSFLADGSLASGSGDRTIKIWDTTTGKIRQTLEGHDSCVESVAFSADGRYLASGSYYDIKIWDVTTGKERQTLQVYDYSVISVAISADGRYLASGLRDKTIKIWDLSIGEELQTLEVGAEVHTMSFNYTASYLHTEIGSLKLGISVDMDSAQDQHQHRLIVNDAEMENHFGYAISPDKCWITWNGHGILWLSPEYRSSKVAIWPSPPYTMSQPPSTDIVIALGSDSGRVAIMRFPGMGPYSLL